MIEAQTIQSRDSVKSNIALILLTGGVIEENKLFHNYYNVMPSPIGQMNNIDLLVTILFSLVSCALATAPLFEEIYFAQNINIIAKSVYQTSAACLAI